MSARLSLDFVELQLDLADAPIDLLIEEPEVIETNEEKDTPEKDNKEET